MSYRITTYKEAFEFVLTMKFDDKLKAFVKKLEEEGHTEKSIAFSIWKTQDKLMQFKNDPRFLGILKNEINKYSWKKGDPRWDEYWNKKKEQEKAKQYKEQFSEDKYGYGEGTSKVINLTPKPLGYIYFIQGSCGGAIKIGYSKDPESRLKSLQTGYPDTLKILLLMPGNEKTEKKLHHEFASLRLNGEWFKPEKELFDRIDELRQTYNNGAVMQ